MEGCENDLILYTFKLKVTLSEVTQDSNLQTEN